MKKILNFNIIFGLIITSGLVFIIIFTNPKILFSEESPSYLMSPSTLNPSGFGASSSNYQIIGTLGETGAQSYQGDSSNLYIGFPASIYNKIQGGPDEGEPADENGDGDYTDPDDDYDGDGVPNKDDETPGYEEPGSEGEPVDENGDSDYTDPDDDYDGDGIPNKDDPIPTGTPQGEKKPSQKSLPDAIGETLDDTLKKINEAIPDQIKNAVPDPVKKIFSGISKAIGEFAEVLKESVAVSKLIGKVVSPSMGYIAILTSFVVLTSSTALQVSNLILMLVRFGYFWINIPLIIKKRKEPWGVVFDSITGQPIKGAIVRLFAREFDKLKESQITDSFGRFGFIAEAGEFYIHISKPGYSFPSAILMTGIAKGYQNIYRGDIINIKSKEEAVININIPLDPERKDYPKAKLAWIKFLNILGLILEKLNSPLLAAGAFLSWISLIVQPKTSNYTILFFYALLLAGKIIANRKIRRSWGQILDYETEKPIEMALIRIYNLKGGNLVFTKVTNKDGQFTALVTTGKYYLVITKAGYTTYQSQPITIEKQKGSLRLDITLKKEEKVDVYTASTEIKYST